MNTKSTLFVSFACRHERHFKNKLLQILKRKRCLGGWGGGGLSPADQSKSEQSNNVVGIFVV